MGQRQGLKFSLLTSPMQTSKTFAPVGTLKTFVQLCIFLLPFLSPLSVVGWLLTPLPLHSGRSREWAEAPLPCTDGAHKDACFAKALGAETKTESQLERQEFLCHLTAWHLEKGRSNRKVNKVLKWCYELGRLPCISAELHMCKDTPSDFLEKGNHIISVALSLKVLMTGHVKGVKRLINCIIL